MTDVAIERATAKTRVRSHPRALGLLAVWTFVLGNGAAVFWLWANGGNLDVKTTGEALTSVARITGLVSAYLALIQVVLLARLPVLERLVGFDRLTVWHRWNGHATIDLVVAHVFFSIWGYALMDKYSIGKEISTMIWGGIYPGMIVATVGTGLLIAVVATSYVIVQRRLRYEWWYAVHVLAYAGIALAWFHQIPTGNELVLDTVAADYWRALYVATLAILIGFRVLVPLVNAFRYRMRVVEVVEEGPGVVSIRIGGKRLDRLHARPGQFFQWRFLDRWWTAHPFSLSEAPNGDSLRITVKALGDHSARLASTPVGTRVIAEGPFGVFTDAMRRGGKRLLIAGGIGITPVRALVEHSADDVVVYRAIRDDELVLRDELEALGVDVHYVVGDHGAPGGDRLLSPEHLLELVPDLTDR
ncbi:MAG TPA: ferric reductase-like transmembrane domain-containing protein, partial [Gaiellaceae bacterium]